MRGIAFGLGLTAMLAAGAAAAQDVAPPESFGDAGTVEASLEQMHAEIVAQEEQTGAWRARRAAGICKDALRRLDGRRTSMAYDAEAGERIWRDCARAYDDVK